MLYMYCEETFQSRSGKLRMRIRVRSQIFRSGPAFICIASFPSAKCITFSGIQTSWVGGYYITFIKTTYYQPTIFQHALKWPAHGRIISTLRYSQTMKLSFVLRSSCQAADGKIFGSIVSTVTSHSDSGRTLYTFYSVISQARLSHRWESGLRD